MSKTPKNILIVVGYQPFPTYFGGAVDVWKRILGLYSLNHNISLAFTEKSPPNDADLQEMKKYVNHIFFVKRSNKIIDLIQRKPLQVASRNGLKNIHFNQKYDFVIAEGEFVGAILENLTLKYDKLFVRVHNNEALYFEQLKLSTASLPKKIYYGLEIPKILKYSEQIFKKADKLWYISADEYKLSKFPEKSIFLPTPTDTNFANYQTQKSKNVLFVGSLFMPNNRYALDWYIKHIHPHFAHYSDYNLLIVGSVKNNLEKEKIITKYNLPKISLYFNQKDLKPFYNQAKLFINPMFHGSGVKIKSIDAITNALPLVATDVGAEGIGLTEAMFFRANTVEKFILQIKNIFEQDDAVIKQRVDLAQKHLKDNHYLSILEKEID